MISNESFALKNKALLFAILYLQIVGITILYSLAPQLFPNYLLYVLFGVIIFIVLYAIDFEVYQLFSPHLYIISLVLLLLPLIIGQVTRGTIRWIPLGSIQIQPSELVRPFLFLFWANYLTVSTLTLKRFIRFGVFVGLPVILILIQPSLGVAALTVLGAVGVIFASSIPKQYLIIAGLIVLLIIPGFWLILAPYQKTRITSFLSPEKDPYGAGYNSIQSMISVGSGGLTGRGLGEGFQTQLAFLPEKQTDFIFAALAEELGLMGVTILLLGIFTLLWGITAVVADAKNPTARAYASGIFLFLFAATFVHVGMNMALMPITGVPLPLVSAGGSSLIATLMSLAIVAKAKK